MGGPGGTGCSTTGKDRFRPFGGVAAGGYKELTEDLRLLGVSGLMSPKTLDSERPKDSPDPHPPAGAAAPTIPPPACVGAHM